jgi:hypothetical protein
MPNAQGTIKNCVDWLVEKVRDVPGDFAEFGVFEGGVVELMAKHAERTVWAFDTFEGIPEEGYIPSLDFSDPPGKWVPSGDVATRLTENYPNVIVMKGRFEVTIPTIAYPPALALVHLDCDNYSAYNTVLRWLPEQLSPGAIVAVDDYPGCGGCKLAVDEFFARTGLTWTSTECTKWFVWP